MSIEFKTTPKGIGSIEDRLKNLKSTIIGHVEEGLTDSAIDPRDLKNYTSIVLAIETSLVEDSTLTLLEEFKSRFGITTTDTILTPKIEEL